jgi:hypothetical protein
MKYTSKNYKLYKSYRHNKLSIQTKSCAKTWKIKSLQVLTKPTLVYGSESWTIKKQDEKRLEAAEMRFMRWTAGYTILDMKRNENILEEMQI